MGIPLLSPSLFQTTPELQPLKTASALQPLKTAPALQSLKTAATADGETFHQVLDARPKLVQQVHPRIVAHGRTKIAEWLPGRPPPVWA